MVYILPLLIAFLNVGFRMTLFLLISYNNIYDSQIFNIKAANSIDGALVALIGPSHPSPPAGALHLPKPAIQPSSSADLTAVMLFCLIRYLQLIMNSVARVLTRIRKPEPITADLRSVLWKPPSCSVCASGSTVMFRVSLTRDMFDHPKVSKD